MQFKEFNLSDELLRAIELLNYEEALPVQEKVIPVLLDKRDCLVQSKTGSGKTASYALPEIEKIDWLCNEPQVLVLTPTRELAKQVQTDFKTLGSYKRINAVTLFGKQPFKGQINDLKQKVHVVIGTVGRILDHLERGTLNLDSVHTCILDEADEMLNLGFIEDMKKIMQYLPTPCTMAMFSATMPEAMRVIASEYLNHPEMIHIKDQKDFNMNVTHTYYKVTQATKNETLLKVCYKELPEQAIIFCNLRDTVEKLFNYLCHAQFSCLMIHGGMQQQERLDNMKAFKEKKYRFMVATDVAARGIDVTHVTHVINFDFPTITEDFIHRIGRSGRVERKGKAISLIIKSQEKYLKLVENELDMVFEEEDYELIEDYRFNKILATSKAIELKEVKIEKQKTRLFLKAGRDKKLRAGDIVGAITGIEGVEFEDVGIIEILDHQSYVEILNNKGNLVLRELKRTKIKNKVVQVEKAN